MKNGSSSELASSSLGIIAKRKEFFAFSIILLPQKELNEKMLQMKMR
jgi:hypothetical protein